MKVLALTSSTAQASIALGDGTRVFERHHSVPRGHTEFMNAALEELRRESGWQLQDLDLIAVDHGPGSFTGIRVSVSIARSLCYALKKPCYIEDSLNILAEGHWGPLIVGINAFKNLIFCQEFSAGEPVTSAAPQVLGIAEVQAWVQDRGGPAKFQFAGDAWQVYRDQFSPEFFATISLPTDSQIHPRAAALVKRALRAPSSAWTEDWKSIAPLYLRASAAEENLGKP